MKPFADEIGALNNALNGVPPDQWHTFIQPMIARHDASQTLQGLARSHILSMFLYVGVARDIEQHAQSAADKKWAQRFIARNKAHVCRVIKELPLAMFDGSPAQPLPAWLQPKG